MTHHVTMIIHHTEKDGDWYIYSKYFYFRIGPMVQPLMMGTYPALATKAQRKSL